MTTVKKSRKSAKNGGKSAETPVSDSLDLLSEAVSDLAGHIRGREPLSIDQIGRFGPKIMDLTASWYEIASDLIAETHK